ncbi:C4-dicarboxylate ABC transporter [Zobellella endophytica]|uniref:C4-dicarboxylate ABC transporter n=1 Tax=Zobellella endophytica TaxID=2116700 RepID=A0A2P7QXB7_9GAMM|nr:TRAP transporter substrate-binding protein [Zobellella endophytica]PSJ42608.1 C4-dicarboxylate ABC transporter [Zobellella endophytica]
MFNKLLTASALTLALTATQAHAEKLVFAIGGSPQSLQGQTARLFADKLQERLGDAHQVEYYDSAQLGDERQLVQKMRLGTVDLAAISSIMSSISDDFALFDLPFLVQDRDHLLKIDEQIVMTELAASAEARGLKVLSTWENGFRQITNNDRPITTPEDLKGLKIRTPQSEWRTMMFTQWGSNPTPMAFSEVFVGLQTGVVDGQENPLTNIEGAKLNEVQKYLSMTDHVYSPIWLIAGMSGWDKFPAEVQAAIRDTAREAQQWSLDEGERMDKDLLEAFAAAGMQVNHADKAAFMAASQPVYDRFAEQVGNGKQLVDKAIALGN